MKNSLRKLSHYGCEDVLLTDRGTFFGYNMLVNDFTGLPIMRQTGKPVCFDAIIASKCQLQWDQYRAGNVLLFQIWCDQR